MAASEVHRAIDAAASDTVTSRFPDLPHRVVLSAQVGKGASLVASTAPSRSARTRLLPSGQGGRFVGQRRIHCGFHPGLGRDAGRHVPASRATPPPTRSSREYRQQRRFGWVEPGTRGRGGAWRLSFTGRHGALAAGLAAGNREQRLAHFIYLIYRQVLRRAGAACYNPRGCPRGRRASQFIPR